MRQALQAQRSSTMGRNGLEKYNSLRLTNQVLPIFADAQAMQLGWELRLSAAAAAAAAAAANSSRRCCSSQTLPYSRALHLSWLRG